MSGENRWVSGKRLYPMHRALLLRMHTAFGTWQPCREEGYKQPQMGRTPSLPTWMFLPLHIHTSQEGLRDAAHERDGSVFCHQVLQPSGCNCWNNRNPRRTSGWGKNTWVCGVGDWPQWSWSCPGSPPQGLCPWSGIPGARNLEVWVSWEAQQGEWGSSTPISFC